MNVFDVILIFTIYIIGTLISLIITGLLINRLVIRKIIANKDVQDFIKLFREGKEYLKQILDNQKSKTQK